MSDTNPTQIHATGEATGFIPAPGDKGKPITVIGTNAIRAAFDATCLQQALNSRSAPGVTDLVLNPDAHAGYGAPVGCVLVSPTHIYPGPGRRGHQVLDELSAARSAGRSGGGQNRPPRADQCDSSNALRPGRAAASVRSKRRAKFGEALGEKVAIEGASPEVCTRSAFRRNGRSVAKTRRTSATMERATRSRRASTGCARINFRNFVEKITQLGSYGGGNHFGECEVVQLARQRSRST